jgi:hypothetical protein
LLRIAQPDEMDSTVTEQAIAPACTNVPANRMAVSVFGALAMTLMLAGCGGGYSMSKAADENAGVTTASVATQPDTQMVSDQSTIRNAVSQADLTTMDRTGMSWTNNETGSRGSISSISEYAESGATCRKFVVSRESYSGVNLYDGDACLVNGRDWKLRAFKSM